MEVVRGRRTREGTLPANREALTVAALAASAAAPPPTSPTKSPVCGAVVPRTAAGVPSPATVSPSHVCAAEVTGATGTPPPPQLPLAWWGGWAGPGGVPQTEPWSEGGMTQLVSFANPLLPPIDFNSLS